MNERTTNLTAEQDKPVLKGLDGLIAELEAASDIDGLIAELESEADRLWNGVQLTDCFRRPPEGEKANGNRRGEHGEV